MRTSEEKAFRITVSIVISVFVGISIANAELMGVGKDYPGFIPPSLRIQSSDAPITVNSDLQLASISDDGTGTQSDPFIIENRTIDAAGQGSCIVIQNTAAYLVIRNCTLFNATRPMFIEQGIALVNVQNVNITGNLIHDASVGIALYNCHYINVMGNNASRIHYTGIDSYGSQYCTIKDNVIDPGIHPGISCTSGSTNIIISNNSMTGGGISLSGSLGELSTMDVDSSNSIATKTVFFYKNRQDLAPGDFAGAGQIILVNCTGSIIENERLEACATGISLFYSNGNNLSNISMPKNCSVGIRLEHSSSNVFHNCSVAYSIENAMVLFESNENIVDDASYLSNSSSTCVIDSSDGNEITFSNLTSMSFRGLYITSSTNTTVTNCSIMNCGYYGVVVYNSINTTIKDGMIANNNRNGIDVQGSTLTIITNCTIKGNQENGIFILSHNASIIDSFILENDVCGISILSSNYINVINNTVANHLQPGILVEAVDFLTLSNNTLVNNQIGLDMQSNCDNDVISGNKINGSETGIMIRGKYHDINDNEVHDCLFGIRLIAATNVSCHSNVAHHNGNNFWISTSSSGCNLFNNSASHGNTGLHIEYSSSNIIGANQFSFNNYSIFLGYSANTNIFKNNTIAHNYVGMQVYSANGNLIYLNTFLNSTNKHVIHFISPGSNSWDNGTSGNYWDDYESKYPEAYNDGHAWTTWYYVLSSNYDCHPLVRMNGSFANDAPKITSPEDVSYTHNTTEHQVTWIVSDDDLNGAYYELYKNAAFHLNGTWLPGAAITILIDGFDVGVHNLSIHVYDGIGGTVDDQLNITVLNAMPLINHPPDSRYRENVTGNVISWIITDASILYANFTIYHDGIPVNQSEWISGTPIVHSIDDFLVGVYNVTIIASDGFGAIVQDTVIVTVDVIDPRIEIDGNAEIIMHAARGNGTFDNPFVIENKMINGFSTGSEIYIRNTDAWLVIQNCTLYNSGSGAIDAGLKISNCSNIRVANTTLHSNYHGALVNEFSTNIVIETIWFHSNVYSGISVEYSSNVLIMNTTGSCPDEWSYIFYISYSYSIEMLENRFSTAGYAIHIDYSSFITVQQNFIEGLQIFIETLGSDYITISNNEIQWCYSGISAWGNHCSFYNNTFTNMYVDAISTSNNYNTTIKNNVITNVNYGIYLYGDNNGVINENILMNCYHGILLQYSAYTNVSSNTIRNSHEGIAITGYSHHCKIESNLLNNSYNALYINDYSTNNTIFANNIVTITNLAVSCTWYSSENKFYFNTFQNPTPIVVSCSNSPDNAWDNGSRGNYWSDYESSYPAAMHNGYTWDTTRTIPGSSRGDAFPLVAPFAMFINQAPVLLGDDNESWYYHDLYRNLSWEFQDRSIANMTYEILVDNLCVFTGTRVKGDTNITYMIPDGFPVGIYNITVVFHDGLGAQVAYTTMVTITSFFKIAITGNYQLSIMASGGAGTAMDPYIIENRVIDAMHTGSGIIFQDITAHVLVRNCTVVNSTSSIQDAGIVLINCTNVKLSFNTIKNSSNGILLFDSCNNTIGYNQLTGNARHGISLLGDSEANHLTGNNASLNAYYGIYIGASESHETGNVANSNILVSNGLGPYHDVDGLNHFIDNIVGTITGMIDTDGDGLTDQEETMLGTSPYLVDTDADHLSDAFEVNLGTDPLDDDSDGDGYLDGIEVEAGSNPLDAQSIPYGSTPTDGILPLVIFSLVLGASGWVMFIVLFLKSNSLKKKGRTSSLQ